MAFIARDQAGSGGRFGIVGVDIKNFKIFTQIKFFNQSLYTKFKYLTKLCNSNELHSFETNTIMLTVLKPMF